MEIKLLKRNEINKAITFVYSVFDTYNYSEDIKKAFYEAINIKEYTDSLQAFGAFDDGKLVGIIASRNKGSHIALFFVDREYQNKGIGKSLWNTLLENNDSELISVHSSVFAKDIYKKLGFKQVDEKKIENGIEYIPMEYPHFIDILVGKDDDKAYAQNNRIVEKSLTSDEYYKYIDELSELLSNKRSYIRIRAFIICCYQAKWDKEKKIQKILPALTKFYFDEKPTVIRQSLNASKQIVMNLPELSKTIKTEVNRIDLTKFKDSMSPLIQKDINELLSLINYQEI